MRSIDHITRFTLATMLALSFGVAHADSNMRVPDNRLYREECGSCHVPYPAPLLPATSWRAVMSSLDRHFGTDASLEPDQTQAIRAYLTGNAGRYAAVDAQGKPLLRITDSRWFRHEHDEVAAAVWKKPAVKSPANCVACHRNANAGDYDERSLRLP